MLIGFKRRFAPYVENLTKTHTIRAERANPPRPGTRLDLYVDSRQKSMRLIGRYQCVKVEPITISATHTSEGPLVLIQIGERLLSADEAEQFAWRDGFREPGRASLLQLHDYWTKLLRAMPWHGSLIHWDPTKPMLAPKSKTKEEPPAVPEPQAVSRRTACLLAAQAELASVPPMKGSAGRRARHAAEMRANRILQGCVATRRLPAEFENKIRRFQVVSSNTPPPGSLPVRNSASESGGLF